ncbi:hypothetical protein VaNZ11_001812, partial [Volvox africanus]
LSPPPPQQQQGVPSPQLQQQGTLLYQQQEPQGVPSHTQQQQQQDVQQQFLTLQNLVQNLDQKLVAVEQKVDLLHLRVDVMEININARLQNSRAVDAYDELTPLVVESPGGQHAVGTAPPQHVRFPANVKALASLKGRRLNDIMAFYNVRIQSRLRKDRRRALAIHIGALGVLHQAGFC